MSVKQGLVLTCSKCSAVNFNDPYPFWNFAGNTQCAGCGTIYAVKYAKGQLVSGPTVASGKVDLLPGYAEDKDGNGIAGEGKLRAAPQARPDPFSGKQKHIRVSLRGKPMSGAPLKKDELVGSRPRFILEANKV